MAGQVSLASAHPEMKICNHGHELKFPIQKGGIFRKIKEIKGLRVPPRGREQEIPQIDAEIAEKGHFWMETSEASLKERIPFWSNSIP